MNEEDILIKLIEKYCDIKNNKNKTGQNLSEIKNKLKIYFDDQEFQELKKGLEEMNLLNNSPSNIVDLNPSETLDGYWQ